MQWIFESTNHSTRPLDLSLQVVLWCGILGCAFGAAGCGNSCFAGFSINGSGGVIIKAGEPPPACSLMPAPVTVRVAALKSRVCDACSASARAQHIYLTMKNIQLRAESAENAPEWFELAPELGTQPRQLDLIDNSDTETLIQDKIIPAGIFRELRLQFYVGEEGAEGLVHNDVCGVAGWNCLVLADGRIEPLSFPEETPELRIPLSDDAHGRLVLLPENNVDLLLSLRLEPVLSSSGGEGLKIQNQLVGRATVVRQRPSEARSVPLN